MLTDSSVSFGDVTGVCGAAGGEVVPAVTQELPVPASPEVPPANSDIPPR